MAARTLVGTVLSNKMDKSVVVGVRWFKSHPLYVKRLKRMTKLMAHDENNECREGDIVVIRESRPLSKRKRWVVTKILERAVVEGGSGDDTASDNA